MPDESTPFTPSLERVMKALSPDRIASLKACPQAPPGCVFIGEVWDDDVCWCVYSCPEGDIYILCP